MPASTRRLLIFFLVLLVVTVVYKGLDRRRTVARSIDLASFGIEEVTRIEVSGGRYAAVILEQETGTWMVTDPVHYPANENAVHDLLEKAAALKVGRPISSNPANHDVYEVGADTGVLVRLLGGPGRDRRLITFYLGTITSDFSRTYLRLFGEDEVYAAEGLLQGFFAKNVSAWRDRTLLALDAAAVRSVQVESPEVAWTLLRTATGGWRLDEGGIIAEADTTLASSLVRTLTGLQTSDFISDQEAAGGAWDQPQARIVIELAGGVHHQLRLLPAPEDENRYWVRRDSDLTGFVLNRSTVQSLLRDPEELKGNR